MRTKTVDIPPEILVRKKYALEKLYELFMTNPDSYFTQYRAAEGVGLASSGVFTKQLHLLLTKEIIEEVTCPTCHRDKVYRLKPKSSQKIKKHN